MANAANAANAVHIPFAPDIHFVRGALGVGGVAVPTLVQAGEAFIELLQMRFQRRVEPAMR